MSSDHRALDLPRRVSLSGQAAEAIRRAAHEGAWREFLPSERRLCEMLQVSRPTVRTALQQLAKEGLIEIRHGRRNRLLAAAGRAAAAPSRLVVLVSHEPIAHTTFTAYQGLMEMRTHLAEQGFTTETLVCPPQGAAAQGRKLAAFLRQNRVLCFVLLSLRRELQEWFAARGVPALVLGSCHPTVRLPSLDVDYRAVCRHAAGVLRAKGHRRIALLVPAANVAGDLASEEGFRAGLANASEGNEALVVRHNGTVAGLHAKLDALFARGAPPTALLIAKPQHVFFTMVRLLQRGLRVPDDVSLIARDYDHLFEGALAHYRFEGETFAHRLSRLMLQLVNERRLTLEPNLIFPRYVAADTVHARRA
ncbi:MAG: hypothetical protein RLZZ15_2611 [Verrucomicrobiota bacterium]|jgi:LacI family transcriptional regulator